LRRDPTGEAGSQQIEARMRRNADRGQDEKNEGGDKEDGDKHGLPFTNKNGRYGNGRKGARKSCGRGRTPRPEENQKPELTGIQ